MQSPVLVVSLQLAVQLRVIGNLARFILYFTGVVVCDVPEFIGTLPVPIEHLSHLIVVEDVRSVGSVDVREKFP
jgi:hypothetical protein